MATLRRIAPGSAFKIGLIAYALLGFILGLLCSVVAIAGVAGHAHMPFAGRVGVFAVIFCPILYGLVGGIGALIAAAIYNLVARWVGGLELEIS